MSAPRQHWFRDWRAVAGAPIADILGVEPRFVGADGVAFLVLPDYATAIARDIERDACLLAIINTHLDPGEQSIRRVRVLPPKITRRNPWARSGIVQRWRNERTGGEAA